MTGPRTQVFDRGLIVRPEATGGTVVMLHHAGATAASLLPLARGLPADHRVVLVDRPGRGIRSRERRLDTFDAVAADQIDVVTGLGSGPMVLFGHSMGAMLAHEVSVALARNGASPAVLLSGTHPTRSGLVDVDLTAPAAVAAQLERLGGTPPEVLADPALRDLAVATLVDDLEVLRSFRAPSRLPAGTGVRHQLWLGADDTTLDVLDDSLWRTHAGVAAEVTLFAGGHFFLFENERVPAALARFVSDELTP